jgi:hypothetical protein
MRQANWLPALAKPCWQRDAGYIGSAILASGVARGFNGIVDFYLTTEAGGPKVAPKVLVDFPFCLSASSCVSRLGLSHTVG